MTDRPDKCPNCGESDYVLEEPSSYRWMCHIGTSKDEYPGWLFYHE